MVTAVDSNIFFDITSDDALANMAAIRALGNAAAAGELVVSTVCYAELSVRFETQAELNTFLAEFEVETTPLDQETAFLAGHFLREYKERGGGRTRILADFLIAAHAQAHADRILTRDGRFFTENFPNLKAVAPADL